MSSPRITYTARPEASPAVELSALSAVFRYVLDCHAQKEATRPGSPDAGKEINEQSGKSIVPK